MSRTVWTLNNYPKVLDRFLTMTVPILKSECDKNIFITYRTGALCNLLVTITSPLGKGIIIKGYFPKQT